MTPGGDQAYDHYERVMSTFITSSFITVVRSNQEHRRYSFWLVLPPRLDQSSFCIDRVHLHAIENTCLRISCDESDVTTNMISTLFVSFIVPSKQKFQRPGGPAFTSLQ